MAEVRDLWDRLCSSPLLLFNGSWSEAGRCVKLSTHLHVVTILRMGGVLPALGCSSTGDFQRWMTGALAMGRLSLKRLSAEGLWGGPFTGDLGRYVKKGCGFGHLSP